MLIRKTISFFSLELTLQTTFIYSTTQKFQLPYLQVLAVNMIQCIIVVLDIHIQQPIKLFRGKNNELLRGTSVYKKSFNL